MTDRDTLPTKLLTGNAVVSTTQCGSLVTRGLAAVRDMQTLQVSLSPEANAERLFKLGMRYRYGEDGIPADDEKAHIYFYLDNAARLQELHS